MEIHPIQFRDSLGQLFEGVSEIQKLVILVHSMASLGLDYCLHPSRHAFNQILTHLCNSLSQISQTPLACVGYLQSSFLIWCQRCSMGLMSGDCAGQSRRVILLSSIQVVAFLEVCLGSFSCWKMSSCQGSAFFGSFLIWELPFMVPQLPYWDTLGYPLRSHSGSIQSSLECSRMFWDILGNFHRRDQGWKVMEPCGRFWKVMWLAMWPVGITYVSRAERYINPHDSQFGQLQSLSLTTIIR